MEMAEKASELGLNELEEKIISYLKQCPNESATDTDIIQAIGAQKRVINRHLCQLKRKKAISANNNTRPKTWKLSHQTNPPKVQPTSNSQSLSDKILKYLSGQNNSQTALQIARSIGLCTKKAVNPALYRLEREQLVVCNKNQGSKPLWALSNKAAIMENDLFKDTSKDTSAPGAYSPDKSVRDPGIHHEKQQHRHNQRNSPYPTSGSAQRSRRPSGHSTAAVSSASSQEPFRESAASSVADSRLSNKAENVVEEMTVTVESDSNERKVCLTNSDPPQTSVQQNESGRSSMEDTGDESVDADEDYDTEEEYKNWAMESRYEDMMGDFNFSDLTYVEDMDMTQHTDGLLPPDDIVLLRISVEPGMTISAQKLAEKLGKEEDEIVQVLGSCGDRVEVSGDKWSLSDIGKTWAEEMFDAHPSLIHELSPHDSNRDSSVSQSKITPVPFGKPPLTPRELIESDPIFSGDLDKSAQGFAGSNTVVTAHLMGRGRGRGLGHGSPLSAEGKVPGPGRKGNIEIISGAHDVRELEHTSFPPSASFTHVASSVTATSAKNVPSEESLHMPNVDRQPSSSVKPYSHAPSSDFPTSSVPSGTTSHSHAYLAGQFESGPSSLLNLGINPRLQKFTEEGLTFMPSHGAGFIMSNPSSTLTSCGLVSSLPSRKAPSPVEIIEQQMGRTGLVTSSDVSLMSSGLHTSEAFSLDSYKPPNQSLISSGSASLPATSDGSNSLLKITSESFAALNKNPISALMEYAQSRRLQAVIEVVSQKGPSHRPVFMMAARVGNRQFPEVTCNNKKDGRKEAADVALRTLIAEGQYSAVTPTPSINIAPEDMTHFDKIAALTHQTFNTLIATIPENLAGRKVIAGLVMKTSEDDVGVVISIGTGNRCITGDKLSLEGNTVNDSHAEIITRRGFMRFLYQQLEKYEEGKPHNLFEPGSRNRLKVKPGITFHLYISTAPCGDGALFSPRDMESNSAVLSEVEKREHHPTFTSNVQGLLRTKMEGGEGTIPVDTKEVTMQTWDGVVRGERLRTMSCTDKICRWNVLGLQGALLSHFLEPIYLDSLTLGFLYDHGHLSRAVCCRLARGEPELDGELPSGYHLNHPWLGRVTACQPLRETQKTKAYSINWTIGDQKAEVLDGTLGQCYTGVEKRLSSRLAKRSLYESFKQVAQHFGRSDLLQAATYHQNKQAAKEFQAAKTTMIRKFQQLGCGWVKKPVEEEMFS